jgi:hypothetical protein
MPVELFTEAERARRNRFPDVIAYEDLVTFFTLSERDLRSIPRSREPHNRLGYALQLCTLRFMGFVPDDLRSAPPDAVAFVAQQLAITPHVLAAYGVRAQPGKIISSLSDASRLSQGRPGRRPHTRRLAPGAGRGTRQADAAL